MSPRSFFSPISVKAGLGGNELKLFPKKQQDRYRVDTDCDERFVSTIFQTSGGSTLGQWKHVQSLTRLLHFLLHDVFPFSLITTRLISANFSCNGFSVLQSPWSVFWVQQKPSPFIVSLYLEPICCFASTWVSCACLLALGFAAKWGKGNCG